MSIDILTRQQEAVKEEASAQEIESTLKNLMNNQLLRERLRTGQRRAVPLDGKTKTLEGLWLGYIEEQEEKRYGIFRISYEKNSRGIPPEISLDYTLPEFFSPKGASILLKINGLTKRKVEESVMNYM